MNNIDAFVDLCVRVISDHSAGLVDVYAAAENAYKQANDYPFEPGAHPMLHKATYLLADIVHDDYADKDNREKWEVVVDTIKNYVSGEWEPTCWVLSAVYAKYSEDKITHSYGVTVQRQNGVTTVETASEELKSALRKVVKDINEKQTDQRYMQNLAKLAPVSIGEYRLVNVRVVEFLVGQEAHERVI